MKLSAWPDHYLGKEQHQSAISFPSVYVKWAGHDHWTQGIPNALFWSPKEIGCTSTVQVGEPGKSELAIRIEELCWVLDKEKHTQQIFVNLYARVLNPNQILKF